MSSSCSSKQLSETTPPKFLEERQIPPVDPPSYNNYEMVESIPQDIGTAFVTSGWKVKLPDRKVLHLAFMLLAFAVLLGFHAYHYQFDTPKKIRTMWENKSRLLVLLDLCFSFCMRLYHGSIVLSVRRLQTRAKPQSGFLCYVLD